MVDETLIGAVDVTAGIRRMVPVLSIPRRTRKIRSQLGFEGRICTIDARTISLNVGQVFPDTPMLAAVVKVSGIMDEGTFLKDMEGSFKHKFASKPEVIEKHEGSQEVSAGGEGIMSTKKYVKTGL